MARVPLTPPAHLPRTLGELRASEPLAHSYSVYARDEAFEQVGERWFRHNEIWRDVIDRRTGDRVAQELLKRNHALVTYDPTATPA